MIGTNRSAQTRGTAMNNKTAIGWMLAGMLALSCADVSPASAQTSLGGAKAPQNKIGGVAKPAPVLGGAPRTPSSVSLPKPAPVTGMTKPVTTGTVATPGQTFGARQNLSGAPTNRSGAVVTSNLKCASGACTSRGSKP
jgi:hypothetical protein